MSKSYKNIPVDPETYDAVTKFAQGNGRTRGGQVMIWARECPHLVSHRNLVGNTVVLSPPNGKVCTPVQIWQCGDCGRLLVHTDGRRG
jgi:hypothetical protein